ncbi:MAG: zinc-ribbon domain containing protein [Planctomycetaceae bacterium]|nr:zinc-ribbon domain containing protein [Planctomycetaceae bacterium]
MAFADKTLKCIECQQDFTYTVAEQELHQSLGYQNEPKRCNPCREAKRQRKGPAPAAGGSAPGGGGERPRREGGGGDRPRSGGGGGGDRGRRGGGGGGHREGGQMPDAPAPSREYFMAICNECGKEAQLPFKPRGDRPVFCSDCFDKKRTAV